MERRMDNRLGERVSIQVAIRLISTRPRTISTGQLKNLSRSGALIADCDLQLFSLIQVVLESPEQSNQDAATIAAYVTRVGAEGVGIEWCEFAPPAVAALLQTASGLPDVLRGTQIEAIQPEMPPVTYVS
jgi:hypothetical protein